MLKEKITVGEAVNLIHESIMNFQDGLSPETINTITYAVNNEIQIRDYLLGMPQTFSTDTCISFITYLTESAEESETYSYRTILACYFYEKEQLDLAKGILATALIMKEDYALALLIKRVIEANWPASSFKQMRDQLHQQVIDAITDIQDQLI